MSSGPQAAQDAILTIERLGHEQVLSLKEAKRILDAAEVRRNSWLDGNEDGITIFLRALNDIVSGYLAKMLEDKTDPKQRKSLRKMRSNLRAYMEAARSLKHSNHPPPYLPKAWYDQAMIFYDDLEAGFEERASGGRKKSIAEWEFVSQCAALFALSFSLEPTSVIPGVRPETGAFTKFLLAIESECRNRLIRPGTAKFLLPKHLHAVVFLANNSNDRMRDLVSKALKYRRIYTSELDTVKAANPYWVGYKRLIKDVYMIP